ncbi:MAG TPA: M23 family metallopeptidase [Thermoanaerobaculia bacterium]|jgi:murein DD-endopeptidase MepM/ murein hydrolase activator NlpD|nr:M23 family metallopeptidase [Thermoanaerobaculia bacterium]
MPRQRHTVIFVPNAHARLRKWQVSNAQIALAAGCLLLLSLAASWLAWSHFNTAVSPAEMTRLRHENTRLRQVNQTFETSIKSLQTKLTSSEDRTRQLAIMAGLESLGAGADVGVGGGAPLDGTPADGAEDLPAMHSRAGQMAGMLDAIEAKLGERVRWMSSTPTIAPVRGILTSGFGTRSDPMTHGPGLHQGIDIAAAAGQPVHAAADGLVVLAASASGYGEAVYLAHGFGISTRYGHLSEINVHSGQRVHRGDTIGRVGSTGRSTGSHLHYEVRLDGTPVNPLAYILDSASGPS